MNGGKAARVSEVRRPSGGLAVGLLLFSGKGKRYARLGIGRGLTLREKRATVCRASRTEDGGWQGFVAEARQFQFR